MNRTSLLVIMFIIASFHCLSQEKFSNNPYELFSPIIGTWVHDFSKGTAYMTFEWGPNQTYVSVTNMNNINGKLEQENFSLIVWDGIVKKFFVSTSYTSPGSLLRGHGTMTIEGNTIFRELFVNYSEGQYMPFLKRMAGIEGFKMPYRQKWQLVNENTIEGFFEVFLEGKFVDPFNKPKDEKKEIWKKKT